MIELALLIAYAVFFMHVTTWEGHIFEEVGNLLDMKLPEWIAKPLYACPICMSFWWGVAAMALMRVTGVHHFNIVQVILVVFAAGGINTINAIISKWYQKLIREEDAWEQSASRYIDN